jgi:hypothetical protein
MYYGARYYDPLLGRFIQADGTGPQAQNPQSLNRYSYVSNNPVRYTDPTGNKICGDDNDPNTCIPVPPVNPNATPAPPAPPPQEPGDDGNNGDGNDGGGGGGIRRHGGHGVTEGVDVVQGGAVPAVSGPSTPPTNVTAILLGFEPGCGSGFGEDESAGHLCGGGGPAGGGGGSDNGGGVDQASPPHPYAVSGSMGEFQSPYGFPGSDSTHPPPGFEWSGQPDSSPGGQFGNWYNKTTGKSLRPETWHPEPIGPHWDYRDPSGKWYRIFPDGTMSPRE